MGKDAARRVEAHHLRQECLVLRQQAQRQAAGADDLLPVIQVVQERIERAHPLLDPLRQPPPLVAADDARHLVERNQPFFGIVLAIDIECDAGAAKEGLGLCPLAAHQLGILIFEPIAVAPVGRPDFTVRRVHLVIGRRRFCHWQSPMFP